MKAYSNDLRRRVVAAYEARRNSQREIAELFGISPATVRNFVRRKRERGVPDALPHGGGARTRMDEAARDEVRQLIAARPDATLAEAREHLWRSAQVKVSLATICRTLTRLGLARKKSRSMPPSATRRESTKHAERTARSSARSTSRG